ncbi:cellulose binding domain-containing protein [Actinomadura scrupuli]|uniref:cellulose binding domain-containing protein n=1 Tax=Actinomadura scrupuli TaxID=559629 RepID=UPI003D98A1CB
MNASDVPDHEPTSDLELPEKASGHAGDTATDFPQAGPDDATDRVPLPIAAAAPWPGAAGFAAPPVSSADEVTHQSPLPPFQPPGGFGPPGPPSAPPAVRPRGKRGVMVAAIGAALVVVLAGAAAAMLWPGGGGKRPIAAVTRSAPAGPGGTASPTGSPAGTPSPGAAPSRQVPAPGGSSGPPQSAPASPGPVASSAPPQPGGAPAAGTLPNGLAMPYRTVQRELGYFEGTVTVTNRTAAPLSTWELSFSYPGAQVRTVWGAVLVQAGSQVIIRNDPAAGPIPPGGTYTVRFGAGGVPSMPAGCRFGGSDCGFTP